MNIQGEVKCHVNGPSQFSPNKKKEGHNLYYLEAENHLERGDFKLYEIIKYNSYLAKVQINKTELLVEQQESGRRARFTIKDIWCDKLNDTLIWEGNIFELLDNTN